MDQFPQAGGSYTRDPETGAVTKTPVNKPAPKEPKK